MQARHEAVGFRLPALNASDGVAMAEGFVNFAPQKDRYYALENKRINVDVKDLGLLISGQ